ncbi:MULTISPECIES: hypothetical protein [unclassified Wolbachia]|uniref:hypothetical protein n=1 Tax=unclassified Wolbachia TaxID=2640676 RepID=UPI0003A49BAC|nr:MULTISPECIES: hypothetical protein [unclassified Wolbachia]
MLINRYINALHYTALRFIHQEKIEETSSVLDTQKLKMSFSSSPLVIPVPRHWDPFFI